MATQLALHQEMMLLALRDEEGTLERSAGWYRMAVAGALFAELLLSERISVVQGKKQLVDLESDEPLHDDLLDECLGLIAGAKRRRRAPQWISRLGNLKRLRHRVAESLCDSGILRRDEDKVLLVFTRQIYPTLDPAPERQLIERLRAAIFEDSNEVDTRTALVASLAHSTGLIKSAFDKRELKRRKQRLEELASGELVAEAAAAAVMAAQAAQTAVIAAVAASAAASSAAAAG